MLVLGEIDTIVPLSSPKSLDGKASTLSLALLPFLTGADTRDGTETAASNCNRGTIVAISSPALTRSPAALNRMV